MPDEDIFKEKLSRSKRFENPFDKPSSRSGDIYIGNLVSNTGTKQHLFKRFYITVKDLQNQMSIVGLTGKGKTNFIKNFLIELNKYNKTSKRPIKFIIIEFKPDYNSLQDKINDLIVLEPGANFFLNMLDPHVFYSESEELTDQKIVSYAQALINIMNECNPFRKENSEFSPQMQNLLRKTLVAVGKSKKYDWDNFYKCLDKEANIMLKTDKSYFSTKSGIENRMSELSEGFLKFMFEGSNYFSIDDLFSHNIIIDLSAILGSHGAQLLGVLYFVNIFIKHLETISMHQHRKDPTYKGVQRLLVVEDSEWTSSDMSGSEKGGINFLERVSKLSRGVGTNLVAVSQVETNLIKTSGIIVLVKSFFLSYELRKSLKYNLELLNEGQCAVLVSNIKKKVTEDQDSWFLLNIPLIEDDVLDNSEITVQNSAVRDLYNHLSEKYGR